jgi:hypothetical protein
MHTNQKLNWGLYILFGEKEQECEYLPSGGKTARV